MSATPNPGQFQAGKSGNPAGRKRGRPKGAVSSPAGQIRRAIAEHAPELIDSLLKASRDGDVSATLRLLGRVCPPVRPSAATLSVNLNGTQSELAERVLRAVGSGEIPAADGVELLTLVRAALGEEPPKYEPMDVVKLNKIYARALEHAESERLRIRAAIEAGTRGGEPT